MTIDILTLFPNMFKAVTSESIIKRAQKFKKVKIRVHNIRDYTKDKHRKVDDRPFGGGPGMVINCQPVLDAISKVKKDLPDAKVVLLSPQGKALNQKKAEALSKEKALILIAGHYEGIDERVKEFIDEELSIGDYVLTGGELAAMVVIDAVIRLIPGVLGDEGSSRDETFSCGLLEYPHFTRPQDYKGSKVPKVLFSGNHKAISAWRKIQAIKRTMDKRPDLIKHIRQLELVEEQREQ